MRAPSSTSPEHAFKQGSSLAILLRSQAECGPPGCEPHLIAPRRTSWAHKVRRASQVCGAGEPRWASSWSGSCKRELCIQDPQGKISIRHPRTRRGPREQGPESLTYTSEWVRGGTCRAIAAKLGNSGKAHKPHAKSEMNRCRRDLPIGGLGTRCEDLA